MISSDLVVDVSHHPCSESEEDCRSSDVEEQQKNSGRFRPIKISGKSSSKQSAIEEKSDLSLHLLSSSSSSSSSNSDASSPDSVSDSSPNYRKTTSSSEARSNYFQESPASRPSSKSLTRKSSGRFKKALMRKSSGVVRTAIPMSSRKSDDRVLHSPVSSRASESGNRSSGRRIREVSVNSKPKSISTGQRSGIMLTRKSSLKPVRKLAKMATFKSKKYSMEIPGFPESCIEKATCSSALKDSKFPDHIEVKPGEERESEKIAAMKVCNYSYCSLHGHSHGNTPPLKRFKPIRKRSFKAQKNKRSENQSLVRPKQSCNRKEGAQVSKNFSIEAPVVYEMESTGREVSSPVEESGESTLVDLTTVEAKDVMKVDLDGESDRLSRTDSSSSITLSITANVREINPKYIRMWQLVYKNVVDSDSGNAENELPNHGVEKETSMGVGNKLLRETSSISEGGTDVDSDLAYRKLELCKNEAIKLVQEAFDKILLSEVKDQSPRKEDSGEKLSEKIQDQFGESSISFSTSGTSDLTETRTEAKNVTAVEEKKIIPMVGISSNEQVPKRWNSLKKLILFKRFIKALEKVRKINPQRQRHLPVKPDPEGEKVYLRRQATDERKNSEEWFLDYALRQVISKLEPAQKRRVSLLVEAFETVLPMPGTEAQIRTKAAEPFQAHGGSCEAVKEIQCQNDAETLLKKLSNVKNELDNERIDRGCRVPETVACNLDKVEKEVAATNFHPESKLEGTESTSHQEVSVNGKLLKIPKGLISRLNFKLHNGDSKVDRTIPKNDSLISVTSEESDTSKSLPAEDHEKSTSNKSLTSDDYEKSAETNEANGIELEDKKNASMWFMIYKHMVSSIDAKDGYEPLVEGTEKEEKDLSLRNQTMGEEDSIANDPNVALQCIEAVKLVNEAIDEIPLPETSNSTSDQFLSATNPSEKDAAREYDKTNVTNDSISDPDEESSNSVEKSHEGEKELNLGRKSNPQVLKNWSNLKKVILLKRFLNAVEKVKKFNPQQPKFLPSVEDAEPEKVQLKHQDTEDRKNAEEWMLDYALQQAVAKLTPARKRKVALLVQAFETVNPTISK